MTEWLRGAWPRQQWRVNQFTVVGSAALIDTAYFLMIPSMPQFMRLLGVASSRGVAVWTGVMIGLAQIIAGLIGPLWGRFADRYGFKINALRTTLALCVIYYLSSRCGNVGQLLFLRILLGLVGGYQTLTVALATQLCPVPETPLVIGSVQISQIAVAAVAPFIGGVLAGAIGIRHTLAISSLLCLVSFLLYATLYSDGSKSRPVRGLNGETTRLLSLPNFAVLAASIFAVTVIDRGIQLAVPVFALAHSADPLRAARAAGMILSLAGVGEMLAVWYCSRRVRTGRVRALLGGRWACGAVLCCILAVCGALLPFAIFRFLLAILAGGTLTVAYALASFVIPVRVRASGFAVLSSCALIGAGVGPLMMSAFASRGLGQVFVANAALYLSLAVLAATRLRAGTELPQAAAELHLVDHME